MYSNLNIILKEIVGSKSLIDEFLSLKTMDEIYNFFLKRDGSITKKEFDEFIVLMLESYSQEQFEELNEKSLENISGGVGNSRLKSISLIMAALTISTPLVSAVDMTGMESKDRRNKIVSKIKNAEVSRKKSASGTSKVVSEIKNAEVSPKKSASGTSEVSPKKSASGTSKVVSEIKSVGVLAKELANKGWIKTADWVKKNKKNVLIGAVTLGTIVIGGGVIYYLNKSSHTNPAPSAPSAPSTPPAPSASSAPSAPSTPPAPSASPDIQGANKSLHTVTDGKKDVPVLQITPEALQKVKETLHHVPKEPKKGGGNCSGSNSAFPANPADNNSKLSLLQILSTALNKKFTNANKSEDQSEDQSEDEDDNSEWDDD